MAKSLDKNEAAFLGALLATDPNGKSWITHYGPLDLSAADLVAQSYDGSYSVMKNLVRRKLVDREEDGRLNHHTGVSINAAGKEAYAAWREAQGLTEKEETD